MGGKFPTLYYAITHGWPHLLKAEKQLNLTSYAHAHPLT